MNQLKKEPKYLKIAKTLKDRIQDGTYEVGSKLPTEAAFITEFSSSKQTVRNAIGLLQDWGLAFSRRGSGTLVRSKGGNEEFTQKVGSYSDLLHQSQNTYLEILTSEQIKLSSTECRLIESTTPENWWRACAIRRPDKKSKPDALLYLYFPESHRELIEIMSDSPSTLAHALLQEGYGQEVSEVAQEIQPYALNQRQASLLQVNENDTGLLVVRRYYGAHRKLIWSAIVFHPPGFKYTSWFSRDVRSETP